MSDNKSIKNYQSIENIKKMYEKALKKDSENITITTLSGGLKNAVYLIETINQKYVLKIATVDESKMITVDRGIFWWEAKMLQYMEQINFPSPKLIYYDDSLELCSAPYIFMTYINGINYLENKPNIPLEEQQNIEKQIGILSKKICSIKKTNYFIPSNPLKNFEDNYEFVSYLFDKLLQNAKDSGIIFTTDVYGIIKKILEEKKESINNVSNICLCHTDIWDGNILVDNGNITGIVDFSDLYFCDELMTFYFHTIDDKTSNYFLEEYGKNLNYDEKVRIEIYRMYVILKMIVDCSLKKYGKFDWMYKNLNSKIEKLSKHL